MNLISSIAVYEIAGGVLKVEIKYYIYFVREIAITMIKPMLFPVVLTILLSAS